MPDPLDYERPDRAGNARELPFTGPVRVLAFGVAGGVLGLAACLALWPLFGAWGPAFPWLVAGLGFALGVVASFAKPARRAAARGGKKGNE